MTGQFRSDVFLSTERDIGGDDAPRVAPVGAMPP